MKVIFWLLFISSVISSCSSSTLNLRSEKDVRQALVSTWEAEFMENRAGKNKVPESLVTRLVINKDGTYTVGAKNSQIQQGGGWSYNPMTQMLSWGSGSDTASSKIVKLTNKELISTQYSTSGEEIIDSTVVTYKRL